MILKSRKPQTHCEAVTVGPVRHASHTRCGKPRPKPDARPDLSLKSAGLGGRRASARRWRDARARSPGPQMSGTSRTWSSLRYRRTDSRARRSSMHSTSSGSFRSAAAVASRSRAILPALLLSRPRNRRRVPRWFGGERLTYSPPKRTAAQTYEPRVFEGRVMLPDEIERIHQDVVVGISVAPEHTSEADIPRATAPRKTLGSDRFRSRAEHR